MMLLYFVTTVQPWLHWSREGLQMNGWWEQYSPFPCGRMAMSLGFGMKGCGAMRMLLMLLRGAMSLILQDLRELRLQCLMSWRKFPISMCLNNGNDQIEMCICNHAGYSLVDILHMFIVVSSCGIHAGIRLKDMGNPWLTFPSAASKMDGEK